MFGTASFRSSLTSDPASIGRDEDLRRCKGGGPQRCAAAPTFSVQPGSVALGGAGLAVRLAVLVAGLLPVGLLALAAAGPAALASLATGATTHGAARPGRQR